MARAEKPDRWTGGQVVYHSEPAAQEQDHTRGEWLYMDVIPSPIMIPVRAGAVGAGNL